MCDKVLSRQGISFASVNSQGSRVAYDVEVDGVLGRAATQNFIKPPVRITPIPLAVTAAAFSIATVDVVAAAEAAISTFPATVNFSAAAGELAAAEMPLPFPTFLSSS